MVKVRRANNKMNKQTSESIQNIQSIIDGGGDPSQAPPFVQGMNLSGLVFKAVSYGRFDMEWTVDAHLTHFDGIVQGGIVNVIADSGQSFAFYSTATSQESYSTSEFTTRFFRPMQTGDVIDVISEVVNRSRRVCTVDTKMINQETGKLCAMITGSWMIAERNFE